MQGLPTIAQTKQKSKLAMGIVIVIVLLATWFFAPHPSHAPEPEESYTVDSESHPPLPKEEITTLQKQALQQRLAAPLMAFNHPPRQEKHEAVTTLAPLNTLIAEGHFIHAILESATHSDLPGSLRAIVSEPVYSEDGSTLLIPSGSRLLGQYKSGMLQGQSRIFVAWMRLITPAGLSIPLVSPGIDPLGQAGMSADHIDRHFWEQWAHTSLLSIIGLGSEETLYRSAMRSLAPSMPSTIAPTLTTDQGKPIVIFVAHDFHLTKPSSTRMI